MVEYKVLEYSVGDAADELEITLNEYAREGWRVITFGGGGIELLKAGFYVILERENADQPGQSRQ